MHRFENGVIFSQVRPGNDSKAADQTRAQVRHNVAVQILHQHHVELIGIQDELHRDCIDDLFVILDLRVVAANSAGR